MITFEWDDRKAISNERKHGVNFFEATSVFDDPLALIVPDAQHSTPEEERWITSGRASSNRLLVVVYTHAYKKENDELIRIISSRPATAAERKEYTEA